MNLFADISSSLLPKLPSKASTDLGDIQTAPLPSPAAILAALTAVPIRSSCCTTLGFSIRLGLFPAISDAPVLDGDCKNEGQRKWIARANVSAAKSHGALWLKQKELLGAPQPLGLPSERSSEQHRKR